MEVYIVKSLNLIVSIHIYPNRQLFKKHKVRQGIVTTLKHAMCNTE